MRPPGPVPVIRERSTPRSSAILRASGEALAPEPSRATVGLGLGLGESGASGATIFEALFTGASAAGSVVWVFSMFGLPPSIRAMHSPTLMMPPSGTTIWLRMPSSKASISIVALSVSTSAITSPTEILSPTFLCHFTSVPSSMVSLSFGIFSSVISGGFSFKNGSKDLERLVNDALRCWELDFLQGR